MNAFDRLAPFVRQYIYEHRWTDLREIQVAACGAIFDTDDHLLLATGTASGKTEAAFMPVLTLLHEDPAATVGVLYIGPLKALINDQFLRLEDLLKEADIPVWHWHGDVSATHKQKLMSRPRGVLQITPESVESLLINHTTQLSAMFADLRFVVIDEVHAFMGSDRGRQVLCQLGRLGKYTSAEPRRIGLSATLGDPSQAEEWLKAGTGRHVTTPRVDIGKHTIHLAIEHFWEPDAESRPGMQDASETGSKPEGASTALPSERYIFESSKGRKCLIFCNSRGDVERTVASLRQIAKTEGLPDFYHAHHGSVAAPLREAAEEAMKDPIAPAITAATVTLELGIDIGKLERIIQVEAPFSVSSFVQRLGRSGRRGNPPEMWLVCREEEPTGKELLPQLLPWRLLQAIAVIQLYVEEKWLEPRKRMRYPFSLLYHQTMSTLAGHGELSPAGLAERVLTLPPFRDVSQEMFKHMLLHLLSIDHIQKTDEGGLIIGLAGERVVRNFRFYAVFPDNEEFAVREESREIGSIMSPPPPGESFALAGRTWEVLDIDIDRKIVYAKRIEGRAVTRWSGACGEVHTRVLQRMRQALQEDAIYPYLQPGAVARLADARRLARETRIDRRNLVSLGGSTLCLFPWVGTVAFDTLERFLRMDAHGLPVKVTGGNSPHYLLLVAGGAAPDQVLAAVQSSLARERTPDRLLKPDEAPQINKYDEFIPANLLRTAFAADNLDLGELSAASADWRA